jgi:hypothetical protein
MADEKRAWFLRLPTDIVKDAYIMTNASATDWRVLLAIAKHQGYQNRRTFPLYIARTAEEARCSRRAAFRSIGWWVSVGALLKTKRRRMNVYEIPRNFSVPPGIGASPRHNTPRRLKRDYQGRIVPTHGTRKVPAHGTIEVPAHGTPNQKSFLEVFSENPLPSPTGGNGRSSETSARPTLLISPEIFKDLEKQKGRAWTIAYAKEHNYPIPEFLLGKGEDK